MSQQADAEVALACATCHGSVLVNGTWVPTRRTVGMICPDCGWDYSEGGPEQWTLFGTTVRE